MTRVRLVLAALVLGWAHPIPAAGPSYNREVRPILSDNCFYCHGFDPQHRKAGLRLDTFDGATEVRKGVAAIVPGSADRSALWQRIQTADPDDVMPPPESHKTLTAAQKETLRRWIDSGAKYESHWAFVAPTRPPVPTGRNPIDHFIGERLANEGLTLAAESEPGPLLRRVTLDLTGLPPTLSELEAFLADASPDAYERAVERLLASPRYGEHMAMAWLDAARYADSNGYQMDALRMNWPWRDWVVRAFNENLPFDRFTIEQLAGDLLPNPTEDQVIATAFNRNHMLNAEGGTIAEENRTKNVFDRVETTGAVWLGLTLNCTQCHDHKFDPLTQRDYYALYAMFNQLSEPGGVDRRFGKKSYSDDYDSLYMVESPYLMLSTDSQKQQLAAAAADKKRASDALAAQKEEYRKPFVAWVEGIRKNPDTIEAEVTDVFLRRVVTSAKLEDLEDSQTKRLVTYFLRTREPWKAMRAEIEASTRREEDLLASIPHVMVMRDDKPRVTRVLLRGNYETPGAEVLPGVPTSLPPLPRGASPNRLGLATWLVAPENPLTARVTVNRFWQALFGRGLIKTSEDFGLQGALPTHPELLDWLAVEFRESGWDIKHLLRLMVTSRTYRQSAATTAELAARDPDNALHARGPRFRLDARVLRDQALAVSGLLVERAGGASVFPYQPPGIVEEMSFGKNRYFEGHGEELYRRSLYTFWRRIVAPANFFDVPSRQVCAVKPMRTSTPLHALTTLNDTTYAEAARVWAARILAAKRPDSEALADAFRTATARVATRQEIDSLTRSLDRARSHYRSDTAAAAELLAVGGTPRPSNLTADEHAAWTTVCLMLLNLDETLCK
jgi:hypothetical protein